jgi:hypothetical protein
LLAFAATLSVASCNDDFKENGKESSVIEANTIAFKLEKGGIETRSEDPSPVISRQTFSMGEPIDGVNFFLEETVTLLDDVYYDGPETKGTPVYTENFADMFSSFYGLAYSASGTTLSSTPVIPDGAFTFDGDKWKRGTTSDPYADNETLYFFLRAPQSATGVSNLAYSLNSDGRSVIEFDYVNPLTATDQQDIVFSGRPVTKSEASKAIPLLFHHVLSGVKFAIGNVNSEDVQTYISKVEFPHALFRSAEFTITTSWENGKWVDVQTVYSSGSAVSISNGQQLKSDEIYSLTLADTDVVNFEAGGEFQDKGEYPASFTAAGNTKNLNDANASKTFWFIPQQMNNNIVMDITFHVVSAGKDSGPITRRVELGKLLTRQVTWKAGELRTYTLKGELLDVDITDKVSGFEKTNVVITNTGNIPAYIRAQITANWFGKAGDDYCAAVGYTTETGYDFLAPWKMTDGTFENLAPSGSGWIEGTDGFFYYINPVQPGAAIPTPLFTKYSISGSNVPPTVYYTDNKLERHAFTNVELVMEIPVQAVEAKDGQTYRQAWEATGASF